MASVFQIQICCINSELFKDSDFIKNCSEHAKPTFVSQSEWAVCIDPKSEKFGTVEKKDFAFVPFQCYSLSLEQVKTAFGISVTSPDEVIEQLRQKFPELGFSLIEEEMDSYQISVDQKMPEEQRSKLDSIEMLLISILRSFATGFQANYAKYFVNNCLIVNGSEPFEGYSKSSQEVRNIVNAFIVENIEEKKTEKTKCELYVDSFEFRPFFGPGLNKLPICDRSGELSGDIAKWNWDELYINPGFDSEKFTKTVPLPKIIPMTVSAQTETIEENIQTEN